MVENIEINKIYNVDCVEGMKSLPDNFVDLTITSPPYDNLRVYKGYTFDFESVAKELYRVTKDGGVVVWVVNDSTVKALRKLKDGNGNYIWQPSVQAGVPDMIFCAAESSRSSTPVSTPCSFGKNSAAIS